jgi:uncharacterized DUF497 family protein
MRFEWDVYKAIANVIKHGISFNRAVTVFDDENRWIVADARHSSLFEKRYRVIGEVFPDFSGIRKIVVVIFVYRDRRRVKRIISARLASVDERTLYEERR